MLGWRNWIARKTSNLEVPGSSPGLSALLLLPLMKLSSQSTTQPGCVSFCFCRLEPQAQLTPVVDLRVRRVSSRSKKQDMSVRTQLADGLPAQGYPFHCTAPHPTAPECTRRLHGTARCSTVRPSSPDGCCFCAQITALLRKLGRVSHTSLQFPSLILSPHQSPGCSHSTSPVSYPRQD
jgi:hypothetical protein